MYPDYYNMYNQYYGFKGPDYRSSEPQNGSGEIITLYQAIGLIKQSVGDEKEDEMVWLTQAQMSELFGKAKSTINEHIRNIYKEGKLT